MAAADQASGCNQGDVFVRSSQEFGSPGLFLIRADATVLETIFDIFYRVFDALVALIQHMVVCEVEHVEAIFETRQKGRICIE